MSFTLEISYRLSRNCLLPFDKYVNIFETMGLPFLLIRLFTLIVMRALRFLTPRAWKYDVLDIRISGEIPEELPQTGWVRRFYRARLTLKDYLFVLKDAKDDPNLKFVIFRIKNPELGWGQVFELRGAIREIREAGISTIAFLESADNRSYYLACACDEIFIPPSGYVALRGLSAQVIFFKGLLDKIKVKPDLMHVGKYKSAAELFTRKSMSEPHREEINEVLDSIIKTVTNDLADDRRLTVKEIQRLIDKGGFLAEEAKKSGLVDKLCYEDEILEIIEERLCKRPRRAGIGQYEMARMLDLPLSFHFKPRKRIALLFATGPIALGESTDYSPSGPTVGADTIAETLRELRMSSDTVGLVMRVSSPGGSALASDLIWREVSLGLEDPRRSNPDKPKKPVIVSMGDVAASGGYYISCCADTIMATPLTITGSIGVVGGKINIGHLAESLGITVETISRGKSANRDSIFHAFTPEEKKRVKLEMEAVYEDFLDRVQRGRKMETAQVKKIAQGRVWTGEQALANGLIDMEGGLLKAIEEVKRRAGIPESEKVLVDIYPRRKKFMRLPILGTSRMKQFAVGKIASMLPVEIRAFLPLLHSQQPLALMPYKLKIY